MTPQESKALKRGERVCWEDDPTDQGSIIDRDWSGVKIKWDNAAAPTHYHHNDMGRVARLQKA